MKTQKPIHIKDPKKVAAGKARAATAIKDGTGKYVSRILYNEVARIALALKGNDVSKVNAEQSAKIAGIMRDAKVSAKDVKELYESKPYVFEQMIENGTITGVARNSNQIEKSITSHSGEVRVNNTVMTKAKAKRKLMEFKQFLSVNLNVVDFAINPSLSFDGVMNYDIPDVRKLIKDVIEYFGVESADELSEFEGAEMTQALADILGDTFPDLVIYSSGKKKRTEKFKKARVEIIHKKITNGVACGEKGMVTYSSKNSEVTCLKCLNIIYKK